MAGFEGWWINGETGKGFHVAEHWMEVRSNPERFGMTEDEVNSILSKAKGKFSPGDTDTEGQRYLLLTAAMKNGWVRIRAYKGKYSVELDGGAASKLPRVFKFLKQSGVSPYSEMLINDMASGFSQRYIDGMVDAVKALKQGRIPDVAPRAAKTEKGAPDKPFGIPVGLDDKQARTMMRQQLGQKTHIPDPSPGEDKIEERRRDPLGRGLQRLLG